jgi:hypothetical protein
MKSGRAVALFAAMALCLAACAHAGSDDKLSSTWTNVHRSAKQPAIISVAFLGSDTITITAFDTLAAAGWHPATTATARYRIIEPGILRVDTILGSMVLDYRIEDRRLVLSGPGVAQVLGTDEPPQTLDRNG